MALHLELHYCLAENLARKRVQQKDLDYCLGWQMGLLRGWDLHLDLHLGLRLS